MAYDFRKDKNPMAVNIQKLQRYNFNFFSLEEVVFYEYLVIKGRAFLFKPFYHSSATIAAETGIKRNKLETIIKKFQELQLIKVELKGYPKVKHFLVNYSIIPSLFGKIYQFTENGKLTVENRKLLDDFYKPFVDSYQKKYNKEVLIKELEKETEEIDSVMTTAFSGLNEFLYELKHEFSLNEHQIKFTDGDIITLLKKYELEVIKEMVRRFFQKNSLGAKFSMFLKTDKQFTDKNMFIEKELKLDFDFAKKFVQKLEETFNDRREMITKNKQSKKGLSQTKIVINDNIIRKAGEAIKVKGELAINNAFIAYADEVLKDKISVQKLLPFFFSKDAFGEHNVIDNHLEYFNQHYSYSK